MPPTARARSMIDLNGRVCLVTGAAQGIGAAVAEGFVRRGARVVASDLTAPSCEGAALSIAYDVADSSAAAKDVNDVVARLGTIDCFIANAGIMPRVEWDRITPGEWRTLESINLDGA